jgi:hypothetical protein
MSKQDWFNACNAAVGQDSAALYNSTVACGAVVVSCSSLRSVASLDRKY